MTGRIRREPTAPPRDERVPRIVREFIEAVGEDPSREGLVDTPARVAQAWREFTSGYGVDVDALLSEGTFEERHDGMVLVKDIDFYSLCEHHLVPFFGRCHVAYVPDRRILGLSKTARLVEVFARRLQVQERMTEQVAAALEKHLVPKGVAVVVEARHLCMMMRGVERHNSSVVTSVMRGVFRSDTRLVTELFSKLGHPGTD